MIFLILGIRGLFKSLTLSMSNSICLSIITQLYIMWQFSLNYKSWLCIVIRPGHRWKQKKPVVNPGLTSHICRMRESFVSDCLKIGTSSSFFSWIIQNITVNNLLVGNKFCRPYETENHLTSSVIFIQLWFGSSHLIWLWLHNKRKEIHIQTEGVKTWKHPNFVAQKSRVGWEREEMAGNAIFMRTRQISL